MTRGDAGTRSSEHSSVQRAALEVTLAGGLLIAAMLLYLAGRPLDTNDMWWHLKMGETYIEQGLWPDGDPLLHTANDDAPVQHEWLFGAVLYGIYEVGGFYALRVFHALAVLGILWLVHARFRREGRPADHEPPSGRTADARFATGVFIVLAWWRLFQLRPDLPSIAFALILYHLLFESRARPSTLQIGAAVALMVIWANLHSLFALGFALLVAALLGLVLQTLLIRARPPADSGAELDAVARDRAVAWGLCLALGLVATLANPRGAAQHLTFFTSSRETGIWAVGDEWTHFDPFRWGHYTFDSVSWISWLVMDAVLIGFVVCALAGAWRYLREPSRSNLEAFDPVLFGLATAAIVAIFVSVRFLWMAVFPILFVLRIRRFLLPEAYETPLRVAQALTTALLLVGFPTLGGFDRAAARPAGYLELPWSPAGYPVEAVRFLREAGLEGNLFNDYGAGGFLGFWLSPRARTFIDSRTEHYDKAVVDDYGRVNAQQGRGRGETMLDLLDERDVDLFLGGGLPVEDGSLAWGPYTNAHLEGAPGWVLVYRSLDRAIYVRRNPRNAENLARVARYYERLGVPFDPVSGLDVMAVIHARPDWALAHQLVPKDFEALRRATHSSNERDRFEALNRLGTVYALIGAYEQAISIDRDALRVRPDARAPRRRLILSLLRRGRDDEALRVAQELYALDPGDSRSATFLRTARVLADSSSSGGAEFTERSRALAQLPLLSREEIQETIAGRYAAPRLIADGSANAPEAL